MLIALPGIWSVVDQFFGDLPLHGVGHLDVLYLSLMINYSLLHTYT